MFLFLDDRLLPQLQRGFVYIHPVSRRVENIGFVLRYSPKDRMLLYGATQKPLTVFAAPSSELRDNGTLLERVRRDPKVLVIPAAPRNLAVGAELLWIWSSLLECLPLPNFGGLDQHLMGERPARGERICFHNRRCAKVKGKGGKDRFVFVASLV